MRIFLFESDRNSELCGSRSSHTPEIMWFSLRGVLAVVLSCDFDVATASSQISAASALTGPPRVRCPEDPGWPREAHTSPLTEQDHLRTSPLRFSLFKKTKLCKFHILGACARGLACNFAHSATEMRPEPDLTRTRICPRGHAGGGCNDPTCRFAHSQSELRPCPQIQHLQHLWHTSPKNCTWAGKNYRRRTSTWAGLYRRGPRRQNYSWSPPIQLPTASVKASSPVISPAPPSAATSSTATSSPALTSSTATPFGQRSHDDSQWSSESAMGEWALEKLPAATLNFPPYPLCECSAEQMAQFVSQFVSGFVAGAAVYNSAGAGGVVGGSSTEAVEKVEDYFGAGDGPHQLVWEEAGGRRSGGRGSVHEGAVGAASRRQRGSRGGKRAAPLAHGPTTPVPRMSFLQGPTTSAGSRSLSSDAARAAPLAHGPASFLQHQTTRTCSPTASESMSPQTSDAGTFLSPSQTSPDVSGSDDPGFFSLTQELICLLQQLFSEEEGRRGAANPQSGPHCGFETERRSMAGTGSQYEEDHAAPTSRSATTRTEECQSEVDANKRGGFRGATNGGSSLATTSPPPTIPRSADSRPASASASGGDEDVSEADAVPVAGRFASSKQRRGAWRSPAALGAGAPLRSPAVLGAGAHVDRTQ